MSESEIDESAIPLASTSVKGKEVNEGTESELSRAQQKLRLIDLERERLQALIEQKS